MHDTIQIYSNVNDIHAYVSNNYPHIVVTSQNFVSDDAVMSKNVIHINKIHDILNIMIE